MNLLKYNEEKGENDANTKPQTQYYRSSIPGI
jgi:rubredoxin